MAAETPPEEPTLGPELPLVYANWVRLVPGPLDLGLDAGYFAPDTPPRPMLRLVLTWEHAKILHQLLGSIIEQREGNVGEIKLPPGIAMVSAPPGAQEDES